MGARGFGILGALGALTVGSLAIGTLAAASFAGCSIAKVDDRGVRADASARSDAAFDGGADTGDASVPSPDGATEPSLPLTVFTDVTRAAGLATPHHLGPDCILDPPAYCQLDYMTGGAAVGDVDADGWPDLYVTDLVGPDHLYRNRGDGTFEDVTFAAGLSGSSFHSNGAAFADVDDDGDLDLYVTSIGGSRDPVNARYYLFVNDGHAHFTEDAVARGVALDDGRAHAGTSVAVGDYDRDGYPDLHVGEWISSPSSQPHTRLFHNRGAAAPGVFEDVTASSGASIYSDRCWSGQTDCSSYTFASAFSDLDDDGWPDSRRGQRLRAHPALLEWRRRHLQVGAADQHDRRRRERDGQHHRRHRRRW